MATPWQLLVNPAQIGTYFVGEYYKLLEHQPEIICLFYTDASTMIRIDGSIPLTASGMQSINSLIMSLGFTKIEIKTSHALESWSGGVLVLVSGSVLIRNVGPRKKFMQTLFLAPQEKGFFVINDIFQFVDEDPVHQHGVVSLAQSNFDSKLNASNTISKPVYMMGGEYEEREYTASAEVKEKGKDDKYNFPEQRFQDSTQTENISKEESLEDSNELIQKEVNGVQEPPSAPVDEPFKEPQKHTYASILRVAKGQSTSPLVSQPSVNHNMTSASEVHNTLPQSNVQQSSSAVFEISNEAQMLDDEGERKSVYLKNLSSNVSGSELEEKFKQFGKIKADGVVIRGRKDLGVCYAFIEFEDINGIKNALQASVVEIGGRQVYIEERRGNNNNSSRGGRRGSYQAEGGARRGRFGDRYQQQQQRDYNRPRGGGSSNGFYRQVHHNHTTYD